MYHLFVWASWVRDRCLNGSTPKGPPADGSTVYTSKQAIFLLSASCAPTLSHSFTHKKTSQYLLRRGLHLGFTYTRKPHRSVTRSLTEDAPFFTHFPKRDAPGGCKHFRPDVSSACFYFHLSYTVGTKFTPVGCKLRAREIGCKLRAQNRGV